MSFGKKIRQYKSPGDGYLYAGTQDLSAMLVYETRPIIKRADYSIDFKTGKVPDEPYFEHRLQISAYRHADRNNGSGIVYLDKETGEFKFFDVSDTHEKDLQAFIKLAEYYWIVNGDKIRDGYLPTASSIPGVLDKSGPLMWWAVNSMRDYMYEKLDEINNDILDSRNPKAVLKEIYGYIEEARKNFRAISKKALNIGSQVHEAIENYLKHGIEPSRNVPDQVTAGFVAFLDWKEEYKVEPISVEKQVYGKK